MACAGNYARVFTTLVEVPDKLVLFNIALSSVLNTTLLVQIIAYMPKAVKGKDKAKTKAKGAEKPKNE
jgi:hypothetical protein